MSWMIPIANAPESSVSTARNTSGSTEWGHSRTASGCGSGSAGLPSGSCVYGSDLHLCVCQEDSQVFVEDYSNNGTFVDGDLVGKDKKLPLVNNAILSLAEPRNRGASWATPDLCFLCLLLTWTRLTCLSCVFFSPEPVSPVSCHLSSVFVFIDLMSDDQSSLPKELQEKYLLTRRIGTWVASPMSDVISCIVSLLTVFVCVCVSEECVVRCDWPSNVPHVRSLRWRSWIRRTFSLRGWVVSSALWLTDTSFFSQPSSSTCFLPSSLLLPQSCRELTHALITWPPQTATRNAETEMEILQRIDHVSLKAPELE